MSYPKILKNAVYILLADISYYSGYERFLFFIGISFSFLFPFKLICNQHLLCTCQTLEELLEMSMLFPGNFWTTKRFKLETLKTPAHMPSTCLMQPLKRTYITTVLLPACWPKNSYSWRARRVYLIPEIIVESLDGEVIVGRRVAEELTKGGREKSPVSWRENLLTKPL